LILIECPSLITRFLGQPRSEYRTVFRCARIRAFPYRHKPLSPVLDFGSMRVENFNINPGGIIGALVCGGIAGAFLFLNADAASSRRGPGRLVVLAVIGGAVAGNYLWKLAFKK